MPSWPERRAGVSPVGRREQCWRNWELGGLFTPTLSFYKRLSSNSPLWPLSARADSGHHHTPPGCPRLASRPILASQKEFSQTGWVSLVEVNTMGVGEARRGQMKGRTLQNWESGGPRGHALTCTSLVWPRTPGTHATGPGAAEQMAVGNTRSCLRISTCGHKAIPFPLYWAQGIWCPRDK